MIYGQAGKLAELREAIRGCVSDYEAQISELRRQQDASTVAEAALLEKIAEQDARIDALEAAAAPAA